MIGLFGRKKQAKILLVDDDVSIVTILKARLELSNYAVITASNGQEGFEKAISLKPDIVLLDNNMPVMTGPEALERLREHPEGKNISVIMVTAANKISDIDQADKFGVDDYVIKPFNTHDLIVKIETIMQNRKELQRI